MCPPPPRPPLFPYTTLFRSEPDGERILTWQQVYDLPELPEHLVVVGSGVTGAEFASANSAPVTPDPTTTRCSGSSGRSDRKSTRLNSSHPSISYAVFCLKKK